MNLSIITPQKKVLEEEIDELIAPTTAGEIAILPNHVDLLTQIAPGEITIKIKNKLQYLAITGGFLHIVNGSITVLSDYAIHADEIDAQKALEAQKRAEELLKNKDNSLSDIEIATAQSELRRAIAELHVVHKRRRHPLQ